MANATKIGDDENAYGFKCSRIKLNGSIVRVIHIIFGVFLFKGYSNLNQKYMGLVKNDQEVLKSMVGGVSNVS